MIRMSHLVLLTGNMLLSVFCFLEINTFFCALTILQHPQTGKVVVLLSDYHGGGTLEVADKQQKEVLEILCQLKENGKTCAVIVEDDYSQRLKSVYLVDPQGNMKELDHISGLEYPKLRKSPLDFFELLCKEQGFEAKNVEFREQESVPADLQELMRTAEQVAAIKILNFEEFSERDKQSLVLNEMILKLIRQCTGTQVIFVCAGGYHINYVKYALENARWQVAFRLHNDALEPERRIAFEHFEDCKAPAPEDVNEASDAILGIKKKTLGRILELVRKVIVS